MTDLSTIKAALAAATEGPWTAEESEQFSDSYNQQYTLLTVEPDVADCNSREDMHLIVLLRNSAPDLIAEVERLRALIAEAETVLGVDEHGTLTGTAKLLQADLAREKARFTAPIVCMCGSTKFKQAWIAENARLTGEGNIVLAVGLWGHHERRCPTPEQKAALDDLHKRKIDLCDWVWVLDIGGYIGESTRSEIEYAKAKGRPVRYLSAEFPDYVEPVDPLIEAVEARRKAEAERDEARRFGEDAARQYNALLADTHVTCAFCGAEYPQGTPRHGDGRLAEHIKTCPEHPMRDLERALADMWWKGRQSVKELPFSKATAPELLTLVRRDEAAARKGE